MDSPMPAMDLEKELTCSICTDLLYQPLTLLDCLHTFCGACLKEWFGWQAVAAETSPNPRAIGAPIFTCPSCRDAVRSTKHNATVVTLLDMLLTVHPDKRKPDDEKAEMDSKYRPGDNVLPKVRLPKRSPEQQRLDAAERRLIDEVREISRQEAVAAAEAAAEGGVGSGDDIISSAREARRRRREEAAQVGSGGSGTESLSGEDDRRHRSTGQSIPRIMGHQSSLRSLISGSQGGPSDSEVALDIEREIAAFARQIQEEGLLDGLDLDNIDLSNDDELSRRIAEAYERRQRGRARRESGRHEGNRHDGSRHDGSSRRDVSRHDGSRQDGNTNRPNRHRASSAVSHNSQLSASGATQATLSSQPERSSGRSTLTVSSVTASRPPSSSSRTSSRHRSHSQSSHHRSRSSTSGTHPNNAILTDGIAASLAVPSSSSGSRPTIVSSSSHHLEVRDDTRHHHQRRRTASEGRTTSLPISPSDPSTIRPSARSQTDLSLRPVELPGDNVGPVELPSTPSSDLRSTGRQPEGRTVPILSPSSSSSSSSLKSNHNSPTIAATASFQARALAMGLQGPSMSSSTQQPRAPTSPTTTDGNQIRTRRDPAASVNSVPSSTQRPATITTTAHTENLPMVAANYALSPMTADTYELPALPSPASFASQQEQLQYQNQHHRQPSTLYSEPRLSCSRCAREHIEHDIHYNCSICSNGNWNICLDCYRAGKGCQHWFGFGYSAQSKWEKKAAQWRAENPAASFNQAPYPPPHTLTASRYLPPRTAPVDAEGMTTEDPQARLQNGAFCARCYAWANSCFWRCDVCNDGDWGFCNECVNQGFSCTHALLPLTYQSVSGAAPTPTQAQYQHSHLPSPPSRPRASTLFRPQSTSSADASSITSSASSTFAPRTGSFRALTFTTTCDLCQKAITPSRARFHCYTCKSSILPNTDPGDYDICQECYGSLVVARPSSPSRANNGLAVAPENGPNGWRRCPTGGHRMVVVAFRDNGTSGAPRRVVLEDLVGGFRLETEKVTSQTAAEAKNRGIELESWYVWYAEQKMFERLVSHDVRMSAEGFHVQPATATTGAVMSASAAATTSVVGPAFPPLGGVGYTAVARWAYYPDTSNDDGTPADDELSFPRHAEIREIEDVNGEWYHGVYMGRKGLFPSGFVRFSENSGSK